ncbi:Cytotoxic translational repressor of toxin-antitoxin stability system [Geoglobus ahangari]|uniref:Cytotoxic translational repressor of toxin-antitoxin stability system n=1 Tax=Geoglobus ahangari TaxID=113653 RepID=A0A0F7IGX6_9EURY|nr:type II toxin-antitoxin system RelE/ParE family toxin [Geoglobus ahangari]AKG91937.1 Cytotoxic translational repressor of toxin-antitoxin stability system [Geoglobus ahangari]
MFSVSLHPDVVKFLDRLAEPDRKRCVDVLKKLKEDPFTPRSGVDIKKLKGEKRVMYRLRIGDYRFEYFVEGNSVYVVEAFKRSRGYRK